MKIASFICISLFPFLSFSQMVYEMDTIYYDQSPLKSLDSSDIKHAELSSLFDGGYQLSGRSGFMLSSLYNQYTSTLSLREKNREGMVFSALPYLGFTYSFGSQASQYLSAQYVHAFSDSTVLNVFYKRRSSNGYLRNSNYNNSELIAKFQRVGKIYSISAAGYYNSSDMAHSGGLVTDTLIQDFGLEFSPVWKSNASSSLKDARINLSNYFNIIPRSSGSMGVILNSQYDITNRKYNEIDTLAGLYPMTNFSTDTTSDQYNLAQIVNQAGVYIKNKSFYFDATIGHGYWLYSNLNRSRDTVEIGLRANLNWSFGSHRIKNSTMFNIAGAFNEWRTRTSYNYGGNWFAISAFAEIGQFAPKLFKRAYYANNYDYDLTSIDNQFRSRLRGQIEIPIIDSTLDICVALNNVSLAKNYMFNGAVWVNDTLSSFSITSIELKAPIKYRAFNLHPVIVYSLGTGDLPRFQSYLRLFMKGKVFASRKLELIGGVDASYTGSYSVYAYNPGMDIIDRVSSSPESVSARTNLHAFFNLGIDEFKFYVRYENIGYHWGDKTSSISNNYPWTAPRIRIGLTWEFFN